MGIIINKSLEIDLYPSLLKKLNIDKSNMNKKIFFHYGGPVETSRGFILHSDDFVKDESMLIDKGVVLSSTADFFTDLAKGIGPKTSIIALGYTGWGPDQLEEEISNMITEKHIFISSIANKKLNTLKDFIWNLLIHTND